MENPPLKYIHQAPIMTVTEQSTYFVRILIGAKNDAMHFVPCLLVAGAGPNLISIMFLATHLFSKITEDV